MYSISYLLTVSTGIIEGYGILVTLLYNRGTNRLNDSMESIKSLSLAFVSKTFRDSMLSSISFSSTCTANKTEPEINIIQRKLN